jgi:hypothetical protein
VVRGGHVRWRGERAHLARPAEYAGELRRELLHTDGVVVGAGECTAACRRPRLLAVAASVSLSWSGPVSASHGVVAASVSPRAVVVGVAGECVARRRPNRGREHLASRCRHRGCGGAVVVLLRR